MNLCKLLTTIVFISVITIGLTACSGGGSVSGSGSGEASGSGQVSGSGSGE